MEVYYGANWVWLAQLRLDLPVNPLSIAPQIPQVHMRDQHALLSEAHQSAMIHSL